MMLSKNYLFLSIIAVFTGIGSYFLFFTESENTACCSVDEFAKFTTDKEFVNKHPNPIAFDFTPQYGEMSKLEVAGGEDANVFMVKSKKPTGKYLFVFHEWWGLNDYVKKEAEKYYKDFSCKVNVIAIDLYDGKVATTREDAQKYMQGMDNERAKSIIEAVTKQAKEKAMEEVSQPLQIATIGWCFGGGWSLQSSIISNDYAKATVMYYGMPEKEMERIKMIKSPVLGIYATKDKWITPKVMKDFEKSMKEADKTITILGYDADHAFANPSSPAYNETAAKEARKKTIQFLKKNWY
ncbi:dienelactone hydrolase family protein [Bernardetia sp.]|uniref:dienelactone hydrolase family protein n=1 Tax=Bernardetia sp. TaxID=1937974 RepID=UPI0025C42E93|nr:dienelactone hydrolase family protein [Bernardetia sp.]